MLDNKTVRTFKTRLTNAKKVSPQRVMVVCDEVLDYFEDNGYPDCWHLWLIARRDAETQILLNR